MSPLQCRNVVTMFRALSSACVKSLRIQAVETRFENRPWTTFPPDAYGGSPGFCTISLTVAEEFTLTPRRDTELNPGRERGPCNGFPLRWVSRECSGAVSGIARRQVFHDF